MRVRASALGTLALCLLLCGCGSVRALPSSLPLPGVSEPATPSASADESPLPGGGEADPAEGFERAAEVARAREGVVGVAVVDRRTGRLMDNSDAAKRMRSASIVKLAIAAYYLEPGLPEADPGTLRRMITRSENAPAYELFEGVGQEVISQLQSYDKRARYSPWWGHTGVTATGQARYLAALADGKVLPAEETSKLLGLMRDVVPGQRWGLAEGVPGPMRASVPVKNGWSPWADLGTSSINCLALLPFAGERERLAVAVVTSFPSDLGLEYGRKTCAEVSRSLLSSP